MAQLVYQQNRFFAKNVTNNRIVLNSKTCKSIEYVNYTAPVKREQDRRNKKRIIAATHNFCETILNELFNNKIKKFTHFQAIKA